MTNILTEGRKKFWKYITQERSLSVRNDTRRKGFLLKLIHNINKEIKNNINSKRKNIDKYTRTIA